MSVFLSAPEPSQVLAPGLYAGLKSRKGYPTPLPVRLVDDYYVNAGFIDGLSSSLIKGLKLDEVRLRIVINGRASLEWYYLTRSGFIRKLSEVTIPCNSNEEDIRHEDICIPRVLLTDPNIALIFFRISSPAASQSPGGCTLINWCFYSQQERPDLISQKPLYFISRSLGDSINVIEQHLGHLLHMQELQSQFPDLGFPPMAKLHIYESDEEAYHACIKRLIEFRQEHSDLQDTVVIFKNPHNLGGGGNMCLALKELLFSRHHKDEFVMIDSDTLIPFKTFYSTILIGAHCRLEQHTSHIITPIISYRRSPNKILEAGAVFGRADWGLAEERPVQPCIMPFHNSADLSDKKIAGCMFQNLSSDYPPFIYSLYSPSRSSNAKTLLPAPFFLRGDDVEYGIHFQSQGGHIEVSGSLLVFQDPKHSLWHELLAVLHSCVIILGNTKAEHQDHLAHHFSLFFQGRMRAHASIHDMHGMSVYHEVIKRILSLLDVTIDRLLDHFYSPNYYLELKSINKRFTCINYSLADSIASKLNSSQCQDMPFLYFPAYSQDSRLPETIILMNHLMKTAAVHNPLRISILDIQVACQKYKRDLSLLIDSFDELHKRCLLLLDRELIHAYISNFQINEPDHVDRVEA